MGYTVQYTITITAATLERRVELAKQIAKSAGYPGPMPVHFNEMIDLIKNGSNVMEFDRKWWNPILSCPGNEIEYHKGKPLTNTIFTLEKGEALHFECAGDSDEDRFEIDVFPYSYRVRRASRIEYKDIKTECPTDELADDDEPVQVINGVNYEYKCKGCSCCAVIVPIYDNKW